jgi:hypothetical protein
MKLAKLLLFCGAAYAILLILVRGIFPSESPPTIALVGVPTIAIALVIARDLWSRSSTPTTIPTIRSVTNPKEDPIKFLSGQIRISSRSSPSYFDTVIRARLKELMIAKVTLETGMRRDIARQALSDPKHAQEILRNEELYALLYGPIPRTEVRMRSIEKAVDMIGAWKR